MSRADALVEIDNYFADGRFFDDLARRVAIPTESPDPQRSTEMNLYLDAELRESLEPLGFVCDVFANPVAGGGPLLVARRWEADGLPTVLSYGHGDVVLGYDHQWDEGLDPWTLQKVGDRWYGRGTADNKGQHTINLAALATVLTVRGHLGFNITLLIETSEETGSPGLREFCESHQSLLAADVFVSSDGPRLSPDQPTVFMGSRGAFNFELSVDLREGGHHSGNWGGLLANPAIILSHALASLTSASGQILVPEWRPGPIPELVGDAVADLEISGGPDGPEIDPLWGEPGLNASEQVFAWNSFEILAFEAGNPRHPVNAIPPRARAHCHLRFVVPSNPDLFVPGLRRHLDQHGFEAVKIEGAETLMVATRLDPNNPWARWAIASLEETAGGPVAVLPNLGGSLPNDVFSEVLGLPTVWVPHSYPSCSQHAPNEHLLESVSRNALALMTGLFWDLGCGRTPKF